MVRSSAETRNSAAELSILGDVASRLTPVPRRSSSSACERRGSAIAREEPFACQLDGFRAGVDLFSDLAPKA